MHESVCLAGSHCGRCGGRIILLCGLEMGEEMLTESMIESAESIIESWLPKYPRLVPWVDNAARAELRRSEDHWLNEFQGLRSLTRPQVDAIISWKWQSYPARRSQSRQGVDSNWDHASRCISAALEATDGGEAVDALRWPTGGIPKWQTSTASAVLAACRPDTYTVADSRALRTMLTVRGHPDEVGTIRSFPRGQWHAYLADCQQLARELSLRLRDIDRAFWAAAGRREEIT
jgi:hypothetical protein